MTNLSYIRSLHRGLDNMSSSEIETIVYKIGSVCPNHGRPPMCHECGSCIDRFLDEEFCAGEYEEFYNEIRKYISDNFYREPVKEAFVWEDMFNKDNIIPCDYCTAINEFPLCNDGATSSACNHCEYNIYRHIDFEVK
jgi:hypothetical protein